jgi:hypothetical protein
MKLTKVCYAVIGQKANNFNCWVWFGYNSALINHPFPWLERWMVISQEAVSESQAKQSVHMSPVCHQIHYK